MIRSTRRFVKLKLAGAKWTELKANAEQLRAAFQRCHLSFRFLRGNEIGVGVLPDFKRLFGSSASLPPCRSALALARCSQQANSKVGSLCRAHRPFLQSQTAIADSGLQIGQGRSPLAHLQRGAAQQMRAFETCV